MKTGKYSVVIGKVSPDAKVGEGSVVIGPTHPDGSVRIDGTFSAGRGAEAGKSSIAIGANAKAGVSAKRPPSPAAEKNTTKPSNGKPPESAKIQNKHHSVLTMLAITVVGGVLVLLCGYLITKYLGIQL